MKATKSNSLSSASRSSSRADSIETQSMQSTQHDDTASSQQDSTQAPVEPKAPGMVSRNEIKVPSPLPSQPKQNHTVSNLEVVLQNCPVVHLLSTPTLRALAQVSRSVNDTLAGAIDENLDADQRQTVRDELDTILYNELCEKERQFSESRQCIVKLLENGLFKNTAKRHRQLERLSQALSGYDHVAMPTITPTGWGYWKSQRRVLATVIRAGCLSTLKLEFSQLAKSDFGKGRVLFDELIRYNPRMRHLELALDNSSFDMRAANAYLELESGQGIVRKMTLKSCRVSDAASHAFIGAFGMGKIESLVLNETIFNAAVDPLRIILANQDLEALTMDECGMGIENGDQLVEAVASHPALVKLELMDMGLRSADKGLSWIAAIFTGLAENKKLKVLSLRHNVFPEDAAEALVQGLSANSTLAILDLVSTNINCALPSLARALSHNKGLHSLSICENKIDGNDFIGICNGVMNNTTLRQLNMGSSFKRYLTRLNRSAVKALCRLLEKNTTLHYLDLSGFDFDERGKEDLLETLKNRTAPIELVLNSRTSHECYDRGALEREWRHVREDNSEAQRQLKAWVEQSDLVTILFE